MAGSPGRDCSICRTEPSIVRAIITEPLVSSVSTWVCLDCYQINHNAAAELQRQNPRLVLTEVSANPRLVRVVVAGS